MTATEFTTNHRFASHPVVGQWVEVEHFGRDLGDRVVVEDGVYLGILPDPEDHIVRHMFRGGRVGDTPQGEDGTHGFVWCDTLDVYPPIPQPASFPLSVEVVEEKARDEWDVDSVLVRFTWHVEGLDRKDGFGISTGRTETPAQRKRALALAARLVRAAEAGAVFTDHRVKRDVYGHTYVSARCRVMGKYLNADLKRLGF